MWKKAKAVSDMAKRKPKFSVGLTVIISLFTFIVGLIGGVISPLYFAEARFTENITTDEFEVHDDTATYYTKSGKSGATELTELDENAEVSVHFLELGNKYTGDCTLIKCGNTEILIDCGSKSNSIPTVDAYLKNYVTDGILEYVIITHAHQDHYAGFATPEKVDSIFDLYECKTIITFAGTNQKATSTMYKNYQRELAAEVAAGAKHYTAAQCYDETDGAQRVYELPSNVKLEILYNYYYYNKASTENDYSACCMLYAGDYKFLFTGDLEKDGEERLAERYKTDHSEYNYEEFSVDLYKAGHHGSKTSSNEKFLEVFKPKMCCVCCCAGSPEYTKTQENQFPTQQFVDRISKYTDKVYVTTLCVDYDKDEYVSFNGNIVVAVVGGTLGLKCSNNSVVLKDSDWFKQNRRCPDAWKTT